MKPLPYRRTIFLIFLVAGILIIPTKSLDAMTLSDEQADAITDTSDDTALENPDWETVESGDPVLLTGRVRRVGSAFFQQIVITDAEGRDWYVEQTGQAVVEAFEQQVVTVRGIVFRRKMVLANGKKLADRRELTDLQVLE